MPQPPTTIAPPKSSATSRHLDLSIAIGPPKKGRQFTRGFNKIEPLPTAAAPLQWYCSARSKDTIHFKTKTYIEIGFVRPTSFESGSGRRAESAPAAAR